MELQSDQSREGSEKRAQESSARNAEEVLRLLVRLRARCARSGLGGKPGKAEGRSSET